MSSTNSDPNVIGRYFIDTISTFGRVPRCIRVDRGSENIIIGGMQSFLRRNDNDSVSGDKSFVYGPSTRNQRIEAWWSIFKKSRAVWWINYFKDMCDSGIFDPSHDFHKECIRFCFLNLLQNELD